MMSFKVFLVVYYAIQGFTDLGTRLKEVNELAFKWLDIRKMYLINVSYVDPSAEDITEIEK